MRTPRNDPDHLARLQDYYARQRAIPSYGRLKSLWSLASTSAVAKVLERFCQQQLVERNADGAWIPSRRFFERFLAQQAVQAGLPDADLQAGLTPVLLDDLLVDIPSRTLLVPVRGESMIEANIFDGDVVIVERQDQAGAGEIVVALVDGELTIKRLLRDRRGWLLHPENPAYDDIRPVGDLALVGVVTGLARRLKKGNA